MLKLENKYIGLLNLWLCLTSASPFIIYSWPGHPHKILIFITLFLMMAHMLITNKSLVLKDSLIVAYPLIILHMFYLLYTGDFSIHINYIIQLVSCIIICSYIKNIVGFRLFLMSFIKIILAMGIGGTIIFILHMFVGVEPIFSVNYSGNSTSHFFILTTSNSYVNADSYRLIRFSGFFDESGAYSLFSFYALLVNKIFFNNKRLEKYLILFTIPSMSMAYFISVGAYFCFFYLEKKYYKTVILVMVIVSAFIIYMSEFRTSHSIAYRLYQLSIARFETGADGVMAGNSRLSHIAVDKEIFRNAPIFGQGFSKVVGANIYGILGALGIIGALFYYTPLYHLFIKLKELLNFKLAFKIIILITMNLYHRPEISNVFTLTIIFAIIGMCSDFRLNKDINNFQTV